jgi:hypothetical protein
MDAIFSLPTPMSTPAPARPATYGIRLKISPADREDAWDLCQLALDYGGVEVRACCFSFTNKERWLAALDALRFRFGPEYFEALDIAEAEGR